jgi:hypothetical protein
MLEKRASAGMIGVEKVRSTHARGEFTDLHYAALRLAGSSRFNVQRTAYAVFP